MKTEDIGYLAVVQFAEEIGNKIEKNIEKLREEGAQGIILDLRNNPGGLLTQAVNVSSNFIEQGTVVSIKQRNGFERVLEVNNDIKTSELPLVILINGGSASASEIVAAAVKDYKRGTLVGSKTFGKGTVQTVVPLNDGSAMSITTARYYTPSGTFIHEKGIKPDFEIKYDPEYDGDIQLEKAIQVLKPNYEISNNGENNNDEKEKWYQKPLGKWIKEIF
jgi:carboxyl-terminal processing protease